MAAILFGLGVGATWPRGAAPPASTNLAVAQPVQRTVIERSGGHFFVSANVNGAPVHFVVDTGADIVTLTKDDAKRAGIPFDETKFTAVARTASGVGMGQEVHIDRLDLNGNVRDDVGGMVLEGLDISLLGQNYLRRLESVQISGDKMILR
jgi:aspartyl protease family protein